MLEAQHTERLDKFPAAGRFLKFFQKTSEIYNCFIFIQNDINFLHAIHLRNS